MKIFQTLVTVAILACWLSAALATVSAVESLYGEPSIDALPTLVAPEVTICAPAAHS